MDAIEEIIYFENSQLNQAVANRAIKLRDVAKYSPDLKQCIYQAIDIEMGNEVFSKFAIENEMTKNEYMEYIYSAVK